MDKLPTHVVEAIRRDAQRQAAHANEAEQKLHEYISGALKALGVEPDAAIRGNVQRYLNSIVKLNVDAAILQHTLESLDDEA